MPPARPASPLRDPAPLTPEEADFIRKTVKRFYGESAVIRNYGPNPERLELHVETDVEPGMELNDCVGVLMCGFVRDQISLIATKRGSRAFGSAKIAYRQGSIL